MGDLTWVEAETKTVLGKVASAWSVDENVFTWNITVPVGSTGTVYVPAPSPDQVTSSGGRYLGEEETRQVYEVGSGEYRFVVEKS